MCWRRSVPEEGESGQEEGGHIFVRSIPYSTVQYIVVGLRAGLRQHAMPRPKEWNPFLFLFFFFPLFFFFFFPSSDARFEQTS